MTRVGMHSRAAQVACLLTLAPMAIGAQSTARDLSLRDQVAVFTAALRATIAMEESVGRSTRLVLVPAIDTTAVDSAARETNVTRWSVDTALAGALLRSGLVAGLCAPAQEVRRCGNDMRGMGAHLSIVSLARVASTRVNVSVELKAVQALHDRMLLTDTPRTYLWSFVRDGDGWTLAMP